MSCLDGGVHLRTYGHRIAVEEQAELGMKVVWHSRACRSTVLRFLSTCQVPERLAHERVLPVRSLSLF